MLIHRLFLDQTLKHDDEILVRDDKAHYLRNVLRVRNGDALTLFNGTGGEYSANIVQVDKKSVLLSINRFLVKDRNSNLNLTLGLAIARGERMDWAVQKAVELGVNTIQPLITERCMVKLNEKRAQQRLQHWVKIAIGACEQCGRNRLPELKTPQKLSTFLSAHTPQFGIAFLITSAKPLKTFQPTGTEMTLLIGPEGGFSDAEEVLIQDNGYQSASLGPRILRNETAAAAALTAVQLLWGDLS